MNNERPYAIRVRVRHLMTDEAIIEVCSAHAAGREISDAAAVTIASWWQSPRDPGMTQLASGMPVTQEEIAADIVTNYPLATDGTEKLALNMLGTWAINWVRPTN